jgi:uncharacterized protein YqhQ
MYISYIKEDKKMSNKEKTCHMTSIGGQAVIEGVMMRGPKEIATAVRKSDGSIVIDKKPVASFVTKYKLNKIPLIRGVFSFVDSLVTGMKCLMFSADQMDLEEDENEPSKFEKWLEEKLGDKVKDIAIYIAVFVSIIFSIGLFMLLPNALATVVGMFTKNKIILNLSEGVIRMLIFLSYLLLVSRMKDIQRVFEYHGAEHKTIATYESGEELTVENARKHSRLHPRCGTSFLLIVMVVSIIIFSFLRWGAMWQNMLMRIALMPVVAGISYEMIKFAGRCKLKAVAILTKPGLWLQKITTREPDDSQLEVAIASLKAVLTDNKEDDKW